MASHSRYRGDITSHGIVGVDQFGLRWDHILLAAGAMPAVHLGPDTVANVAVSPSPSGHDDQILAMPVGADSAPTDDAGGADQNPTLVADMAAIAGAPDPDPLQHQLHSATEPLNEASLGPVPAPADQADPAPPAGVIPKGEALIWSGPAIMAFPGDPHDGGNDASPAPGNADISAAFLPPDGGDPAHALHGLDPGLGFTVEPMPPPPDIIG